MRSDGSSSAQLESAGAAAQPVRAAERAGITLPYDERPIARCSSTSA
jgi:hypothetical protein